MIQNRWEFIDFVTDITNRYPSLKISDEDARQMIHDLLGICKDCVELGWRESKEEKYYNELL